MKKKMKKINILSIIVLVILCIPLLILSTKNDLMSSLWFAFLIVIMYTLIDIWVMANTTEFSDQSPLKKDSDLINRFFQDLVGPVAMLVIGYSIGKL